MVSTTELYPGTWTVKVRATSISTDNQPFAVVTNKGFNDVNFLNCKVLDVDKWATPKLNQADVTPDLRFVIYSKDGIQLETGTNPPQYRYSKDGGSSWEIG